MRLDGRIFRRRIPLEPSDRWRLFAVAARDNALKSEQELELYAERLRARRAMTHAYSHGRGVWLQGARTLHPH